jgi:hypothetical protein
MGGARQWFELECRHCGQRFVDMARLLFHPCPSNPNAEKSTRHSRRPAKRRNGRRENARCA